MASSTTTPGEVAGTAGLYIIFGIIIWAIMEYRIYWAGGSRLVLILPGFLVIGGAVAECVALVGWLTGTTWHSG
jgi:hypothetical protein